jgi:hypothetical protein
MKALFAGGAAVCAAVALAAWFCFGAGDGAGPGRDALPAAAVVEVPGRLVVHEWGTFTSFSGSDGVPVGFRPDNNDLPGFVYRDPGEPGGKGARLARGGTVSMETPVLYFYTNKALRASVRVDFPLGWITEWYPFAAAAPAPAEEDSKPRGQHICWDVRLLPGEAARLPIEKQKANYYQARATDSVPLRAEMVAPPDQRDPVLRGGTVVQQEKFLFYRGVGTFPPPVTVRALGQGKVRVTNGSGQRVGGLVLVAVRAGTLGFKALGGLDAKAEVTAELPAADARPAALAEVMVRELTGAGLYEKEARAMVKTWESAWFGEEGTRLLYLVPRARTDELLPLTVEPRPAEVVRVLVGRHDFLTPEQEASAERLVRKAQAAQAELQAAEQDLSRLGRFAEQARRQAEKRIDQRQEARARDAR